MESEEHKLLMAMRACGLENEELLAAFYNRVAQTLNIDGGYIILLVHDTYSVPYRSSDGLAQHDASDEEFSYFICSICPVKQTQPVLSYQLAENCFNALNNGFAVSAPQLGFMFPAFDNRAANIYATLYYTKSTADNHPEFTTAVFGIEPPMPAASQKEVFRKMVKLVQLLVVFRCIRCALRHGRGPSAREHDRQKAVRHNHVGGHREG